MMGEEEPQAIQLTDDKETTRMKLMCLQLAKSVKDYKELYYETDFTEVYEILMLTNAINFREENEL